MRFTPTATDANVLHSAPVRGGLMINNTYDTIASIGHGNSVVVRAVPKRSIRVVG